MTRGRYFFERSMRGPRGWNIGGNSCEHAWVSWGYLLVVVVAMALAVVVVVVVVIGAIREANAH